MENIDIAKLEEIGRGKTGVVYAYNKDKIIKMFYKWVPDYLIDNEKQAAELAFACGINTAEIFAVQRFGEQEGIVYARLKNISLEQLLTKHFWQAAKFGKEMAQLHLQLHRIEAKGALPAFKAGYAKHIADKASLNELQKKRLLDLLDNLPDGTALCHGDFHPQNILIDNGVPFVIDWMASTEGHPMADVCGTYLIVNTAHAHKKMSGFKKNATKKVLDRFLSAYLDEYFRQSGFTARDLNLWLPIKAAQYMDVGLPRECEDIFLALIDMDYSCIQKSTVLVSPAASQS